MITETNTPVCPGPEVLGAFAEGRLGENERERVVRHLATCDVCLSEVATISDFVREEKGMGASVVVMPARTSWWLAVAAAIVVVIGGAFIGLRVMRGSSSVGALADAAEEVPYRNVEARLSGFAWAEFRGPARGGADARTPEQLRLAGEAGQALARAESDESTSTLHAAAIAELLVDEPDDAITRLTRVTSAEKHDARAWSDLAAAFYAAAARHGRDDDFVLAVAAANRALEADARLPEALFNRALALERMGKTAEAREAWQRYLDVDAGSAWANEARTRLASLR